MSMSLPNQSVPNKCAKDGDWFLFSRLTVIFPASINKPLPIMTRRISAALIVTRFRTLKSIINCFPLTARSSITFHFSFSSEDQISYIKSLLKKCRQIQRVHYIEQSLITVGHHYLDRLEQSLDQLTGMKTLVPLTPRLQIVLRTRRSVRISLARRCSVNHDAKPRLFPVPLWPWQTGCIHFQALPPVFASYARLRLPLLKYSMLMQVKPDAVNALSVRHLLRVLLPASSNQSETSQAKPTRTLIITAPTKKLESKQV